MTYLLDTCILSKLRKLAQHPDPQLQNWLIKHPEDVYFVSALTLGEIQMGIAKLSTQNSVEYKYRMLLEDWLLGELIPRFQGRILALDLSVALTWGKMQGQQRQKGINVPIANGLIAATAIQHDLIVVTENSRDFASTGAEIFNPWQ